MSPISLANVSKQMMQKMLLRKFRPHSSCATKMEPINLTSTPKTQDDLIYTFEEGIYRLFQVKEMEEDILTCQEFNLEAKSFRRHQTVNFGCVGVFVWHGFLAETVILGIGDVKGKVIKIGALLLTVPKNVLTEH